MMIASAAAAAAALAEGGKGNKKNKGRSGDSNKRKGKGKDRGEGNGKSKCAGWIDYAKFDDPVEPFIKKIDAAQRALAWYTRLTNLIPETETLKLLAEEASASKISWEVQTAIMMASKAIERAKGYKDEAQKIVTRLEAAGDQRQAYRGIFSKSGPRIRADFADQAYLMLSAGDAVYGQDKDVLELIYDQKIAIQQHVRADVITSYGAVKQTTPITFSSNPVRILYNIRNDFFVVFYGVEPQINEPWVAYTIRISDSNLVDWNFPSKAYYKTRGSGEEFEQFRNVNNRDSEYVEIPLTASPYTFSSGGSKGRSPTAISKAKAASTASTASTASKAKVKVKAKAKAKATA